ncbi:RNA polymerase factor sigma-54 [Planomicrobium sp. YIM 101495]|uniref:RNA polymerase factor sigma-54 n=1 Tax=Planomicrobium sp. YIM 101495 TaxID=2665160 RepID=UPI0012B83D94|nr:RNA polymerase factor sigma-54 [Planomicrobium sp. YIM 101495]MTD30728.1 RNA polymerase factor sigma-54 [Planomicrobium sp. YIM 101495]
MSLKLETTLKQKMIISQTMVQSLDILSYSAEEIQSWLKEQEEKNPCLKFENYRRDVITLDKDIRGNEDNFIQEVMEQLLGSNISKRTLELVKLILADLSDTGFLTQSREEMSACFRSTIKEVNEAIALIQSCEPKGMACKNLQEFLVLQADKMPIFVKDILSNYYNLFLHQKWGHLSKESGYSLEKIKETAGYISKMKTRPLSREGSGPINVAADITVEICHGELEITLHPHAFPQTAYDFGFVNAWNADKKATRFLRSQMLEAKMLAEQLQLRRETAHRIIEKIVDRQERFFMEEPNQLKSLTMTDLANELNLSVSTVSRAVQSKYVETPHGLFSMRHFFANSNNFLDESKMTKNQLKNFIYIAIKNEDKKKPVSDQKIVERLHEKGIDVSRRVIAKYRDQMNLPASYNRKIW